MNFNTDLALWVSFFRAYPSSVLSYNDGAVYVDGKLKAVFSSDKDAKDTIAKARAS